MALCASLWTAATYSYLPGIAASSHWPLLILVGAGTLMLYNVARYPFHASYPTQAGGMQQLWLKRHPVTLGVFMLVGIIGVIAGLSFLPFRPLWPLGVAGVLVTLYYAPIGHRGPFGLRMYGLIKNLVIGLVWAVITVLLPFTITGQTRETPELVLGLLTERTIFIYLLMLPFDLEDVDRDAREGVTTIPGKYGYQTTKRLMLVLSGILVSLQLILFEPPQLWAHLLSSAYITGLIIVLRSGRSALHYLGFWDGAIAFQAVLLLLISGGF